MRYGHFNHPYNHHPPSQPPHHHPLNHHHHHPNYEQQLIDEVLYLHSLWHRGPPSSTTSNNPPSNAYLGPTQTTPFKKKTPPRHVSDKEWPVHPKPPSPSPAWPDFNPRNNPTSRPASAAERDTLLGIKVQLNAVRACSHLFRRHHGNTEVTNDDDNDHDHDHDDEDGDEDEDEDGVDDEEKAEFFRKVFEEDGELRGYYKKSCESGEFYCLVCGVIGNKVGRKYKGGVALVQHCVTISKMRKTHRAYGGVICEVLGWDIDRLPSLQAAIGDGIASRQALEDSSVVQEGEVNNNADLDDLEGKGYKADVATTSSQADTNDIPGTVEPKSTSALPIGSGWPEFKPRNNPNSRSASAEERDRVLGIKIQSKAVQACSQLFRRRSEVDDDSDDDDDDDDEDDDDEDEVDEEDDEEEVEFFTKVFEKDKELRGYYKRNCESGEFYCLVCGVIGNKVGRKYKGGIALIQHSVTISKMRKTHRAYGSVICKVLGWDIDQLSSLQSAIGDGSASSQALGNSEVEVKNHVDGCKNDIVDAGGKGFTVYIATTSSQADPNDIPDTVETIVSNVDAGCIAGDLTQSESERLGSADVCEIDDRDGFKDSCNTEKLQSQQEIIHGSFQVQLVNEIREGCSAPCSKAVDSVMNDDAYQQLELLPREFQIPD